MNRCHHAGKTEDQKGELPMMHVHAERPRHIPPHERRAMVRIEFDEQDWPLWVKVFGDDDTAAAAEMPVRRRRAKAVVKIDEPSDDAAGKAAGDSSAQPAVKRNVRRPRRKKEEAETKELFAFYEQSLF